MATKKLSIFLLARSLAVVGGAERQLVLLAKGLKSRGHFVQVGTFYGGGVLAAELHEAGIEVVDLEKRGRWHFLSFLRRVVSEIRRRRPDLTYSFLGSANLVAAAAHAFVPETRLIWSVRASNMDLSRYDWLHGFGYRVERRLSASPDLIIANSSAGASFAIHNGFPPARIVVIPNGIDTDRFRPDAGLRASGRRSFGLREDDIALGVLARLDPQKGHSVFLKTASLVAANAPKARFLCIGSGPELDRLKRMAEELQIADRVIFTGEREPAEALNALDIACSCSVWGEGFSNSLAEAMACGLPCVATDVGDSAFIVGSTGSVVPPDAPDALAAALLAHVAILDRHDPDEPRSRIVENFSPSTMVERTLEVFRSVVTSPR